MHESVAKTFLNKLWTVSNAQDLQCCDCGCRFQPHDALARTFCLKSQASAQGRRNYAASFEVPELSDEILIFHRHLSCLSAKKYVAISHVWSRDVADIQNRKNESSVRFSDAAHHVREVPAQICKALATRLGNDIELWHDYISVPQWQVDMKRTILRAIHSIFKGAAFTTVHSFDLTADMYRDVTQGSSMELRCRAISNICNIKYFSRVWTAMEYTQSEKIYFMTKDYTLLSGRATLADSEDDTLFTQMSETWDKESKARGHVQDLEKMVGMGYNLVPWQLGPLETVRQRKKAGHHIPFALAHALLARRCVTLEHDYLHALQGMLQVQSTLFETDLLASIREMAHGCLLRGDLSPLLTIPASVRGSPPLQIFGYHDIESFGLGNQVYGPTYNNVKYNRTRDNFTVRAEQIGVVQHVFSIDYFQASLYSFAEQVRLVLECEGTDVNNFVRTVGGRLYGQDTRKITSRLSEEDRKDILASKLKLLSGLWPHYQQFWQGPRTTFELIPGKRPHLQARRGIEETTIDLAGCLGNKGGTFDRSLQDFHLSARALELNGTTLTAELRNFDGEWQHDEVDVRRLGMYFEDGSRKHVDWIADAIGLTNHALGSEMTPLTPIEFLQSHGNTIHRGSGSAFLGIVCPVCRKCFLIRAPLFADAACVEGSTAWRIPGLKYEFTLEGGAGFLLNGDSIVGRFVWAAQTCDCFGKLADVKVRVHDLPIPQPNTYEYGKLDEPGWVPI